MKHEQRRQAESLVPKWVLITRGFGIGATRIGVFETQTRRPAVAKPIEQLAVEPPVGEGVGCKRFRTVFRLFFSGKVIGFVMTPNQFGLPLQERPAPKVVSGTPGHF